MCARFYKLTHAPANGAAIGGLKVCTENGWFAARPSGTEPIHEIYAESFRGADHLRRLLDEAQTVVAAALSAASAPVAPVRSSRLRPMSVSEAKDAWRNEGDPN